MQEVEMALSKAIESGDTDLGFNSLFFLALSVACMMNNCGSICA